ncbi:fimbrial protein StaE [Superficieibacter electus]|uniref:Fimbrial protein StaE n=1 Tax=Superficieibacter electus TaxID=2022662 RepID=A0A2P5GMG4_9ENTR|nr:fimbrial protein StaE [Superficieibacter electus]POP41580.1 fimbrial protein StaE [Superficieibacter electus]POP47009.1 fimbrial protein StaE [Superficieibacter electus]
MKFHSLFLALVATSGLFSHFSYAESTQLRAEFHSEILVGTCTAKITHGGTETATVDFGDVFKGDIGTRAEAFNVELSGCIGVKTTTVAVQPGAGNSCSGEAYNTVGNTNTAVEIWSNAPDTGTKLACKTGESSVSLSHTFQDRTKDQAYTYPMVARWVVANGKMATDVKTGEATSLITFLVTYQ